MNSIDDKIKELGGMELTGSFVKEKENNFDIEKYSSENDLKLPDDYQDFSQKYGFHQFNNDVVFKSIEKLPITSDDNLYPVDFIYGWGSGENGLPEIRETFLEQIPNQYFVFAEGNAGDQICIHLENHKIYYWHHQSPEGADLLLVANSFENFIKSLEINNSDVTKDSDLEEEWFADDF